MTANLMTSKILIIDDDESFKKILEVRLKSFLNPLEITWFNRTEKARQFLKEKPEIEFNLVILDQNLPDGRGLDLLQEGWFKGLAVLSMSSDDAPTIPGDALRAGAAFFLNKSHASQALFQPLVLGIIDRNRLQRELEKIKVDQAVIDTVKTLILTLKHEINNPLGAVLGAAYLLRNNPNANEDQKQAAELVESSGQRIKHVIEQLSKAMSVDPVTKANQTVYHIPGDKPWDKE
jgi:response regulator of citrate/malate metabolism